MDHFHNCEDREVTALLKDFSTSYKNNTLVPDKDKCIKFWVEWYTHTMHKTWQQVIFNNMFNRWWDVLKPIWFKRVWNKEKDSAVVKIFFRKNWDADLPALFKPGSLAYAFPPYWGEYHGHLYINLDNDFQLNEDKEWAYALLKVLVHEAGHLLNVNHSEDPEDIMYWKYQRKKDIFMTEDTQKWIRQLYSKYF